MKNYTQFLENYQPVKKGREYAFPLRFPKFIFMVRVDENSESETFVMDFNHSRGIAVNNWMVLGSKSNFSTSDEHRRTETDIYHELRDLFKEYPTAKEKLLEIPVFFKWFDSWEKNYDLKITSKKYGL